MVSVNVDITAEDSPIPNALDQYYSFLVDLTAPNASQRLALNSSIVTFDVIEDAPMYTEHVFRAFADRTVTVSPTSFSPVALGLADTQDRYSRFYTDLLRRSIAQIDGELDQPTIDKIALLERDVISLRNDLQKFFETMFTSWDNHASKAGIKPDDPYYLDKQTSYFTVMNFATQLQYYRDTISDRLQKMFWLRETAYSDPEDRHIAALLRNATLSDNLVPRPKTPQLEEVQKYDPIKLGQLYIYNNLNYFETGPEISPSGYLPKFLKQSGKRSYTVTKGATADYVHDESWSVKGSGRKFFFFKASAEAKYEKHIKDSIQASASVEIGFENISEYWVNRGQWFSSSVFNYKRVREVLSKDTRLAGLLANAISSVVIARGMTVKYTFSSAAAYNEWSSFTSSGSGGFSIFGMTRVSTNATYSSYTMNASTATDGLSVTFSDSADHVRLLGFKVDRMFDGAEEASLANAKYIDEVDFEALRVFKSAAAKGDKVSPTDWGNSKSGLERLFRQKLLGEKE